MIGLENQHSMHQQFFMLWNDKQTWSCNPRASPSEASTAASTASSDVGDADLERDFEFLDLDSKDGQYYKSCKEANFEFAARGCAGNPQGGRWQRYIKHQDNAKQKAEYESLKGNLTAQAEFRRKWCEAQYKNHVKERKHVLQRTTREYNDARYLTVDRCIVEDANKTTAVNYCLRCLTMGYPWVKYCSWRKATLFLYKLEGIQEEQIEQWSLTKTTWEQKTRDYGVNV